MSQYQTQLAREVLGGEPSIIAPPPIKVHPKPYDGWGMGTIYGNDAKDMLDFQNRAEKILGRRIKNKQIVIACLAMGIDDVDRQGKDGAFFRSLRLILQEK